MQRLAAALARHPWAIFLTVLALSLLSAATLFRFPNLTVDPSVEALLPPDDGDRAVLERVRGLFGQDAPVIIAIEMPPQVLTVEHLRALAAATRAVEALRGIVSAVSIATAPNVLVDGDDLDIATVADQAASDPAHLDALRSAIAANRLYAGTLVSGDGSTATMIVRLRHLPDGSVTDAAFVDHVRAAIARALPDSPTWITGTDVIRQGMSRALERTFSRTIPAVFGLVLVLLFVAFRSARAVFAALATVILALLWTLALARLAGVRLNLVTAIVPPLVAVIGLSYTVHVLSAFFLGQRLAPERRGAPMRQWVMERIGIALLLSVTTTVAGFLSLLVNPLHAVRQFALLASAGSVIAGMLTLVFLPTLLLSVRGADPRVLLVDRLFERAAQHLAAFDLRHRSGIIAVAAVVVAVSLGFATQIHTGSEFIRSFEARSEIRRNFDAVSHAIGGANLLPIVVEAPLDDALVQPEVAWAIDALEEWLRAQPEVGGVSSYLDVVKLTNRNLHSGDRRFDALPADARAIAQLLSLTSGQALRQLVDARQRTALMTVRLRIDDSVSIDAFLQRLDSRLARLPDSIRAVPTGSTVLATRAVSAVASGHILSVAIATFVIFALLSVLFTSARAALIATIPNLVPVTIYFGMLGLFHITLNPATSLVACIVLGIAVNDTVHFLVRFNDDARHQGHEAGAVSSALAAVLRPITLATLALCLGLLLLTMSELHAQKQFGGLAAITLALAWLADMTLTPALGSRLRIVTLWDLLRLDLGPSPQHTIPLLAGLTLRQARMFALTARLETQPAGAQLIREGDYSRDIFVVIEGTVEAWVERHGKRKVLSSMSRGAVLGEAGMFGQRRTAHVGALTAVRVLRFDSQDLERLRIRYPRIAATVLRNLNRVQAERIARMTSMLR